MPNSCASLFLSLLLLCVACSGGADSSEQEAPVVIDGIFLSDEGVLERSIGIATEGGVFTAVIMAGSQQPVSEIRTFSTAVDFQESIAVGVYTGNVEFVEDAELLGRFKIVGIPALSRGVPQIAVTFAVSGDRLTLSAEDKVDGRHYSIEKR